MGGEIAIKVGIKLWCQGGVIPTESQREGTDVRVNKVTGLWAV